MAEGKARKLKKTQIHTESPSSRKRSKWPLYILIIATVVIFTLLGIGLYFSLGSINPSLVGIVVVLIVFTIVIELITKREIYLGRERMFGNGREEKEGEASKPDEERRI